MGPHVLEACAEMARSFIVRKGFYLLRRQLKSLIFGWHCACTIQGGSIGQCNHPHSMNTGQTILVLGSFLLLSTILLSFYSIVANSSDVVASGQDGILATTLATSYMEVAQGLAFDQVTDTSDIAIGNPNMLTPSTRLGPDTSSENSIGTFNDFDDFKGFSIEEVASGTNRRFRTTFDVNYVDPNNVNAVSTNRTFIKRMDLKTWRTFPPVTGKVDTLRLSMCLGYFHFD
jgi:hypothetical protein